MRMKRLAVMIALAAAVTLAPVSSAFGQQNSDAAALQGFFSTSIYGLTTTAVVGGVVLTVILVMGASSEMETYMEQNAVAIQHDLYLGAGETSRDLAGVFNVPEENYQQFATLLFDNRHQLAPLAVPGEIDAVSAHKFVEIIVENMLRDRTLAPHVRSVFG